MTVLLNGSVVILAYAFAHGLTALLITPLQSRLLPDVTAFASLVYLPHGVRVLSTWLLGKRAFVPLCLGAFLSEALFTPAEFRTSIEPLILLSIAVGAAAAPLAFEAMALAGRRVYAGQRADIHWKWLLLAGALASVINSVGQSLVFSGHILPDHSLQVLATYAVGDIIGLVVTTLALMLIFRWIRLFPNRAR
ncbi:hypothetical protein CLG85_025675 [Yangia mangrovi]|uniref:Uncharacterized protein n=1 Tax=Alloyangia mangrovi TaxID=1779329 RepID=A0A2A3JP76_9RHOB|nr:hypothetical protein [Alloyangia mangrovi]MCA0943117.1 hypothetical protein [Alloyangia pacifica]MCA0948319.1 hypothetical protein [Alloyangia pacifica]MCT4373500.1 hypothetical protein [Alloyangia mangrovi]